MTVGPGTEARPVRTDAAAIEEVAALLARAFPAMGHLGASYLRWAYAENPDGPALGFNAYDGARLAAHYVTQPLRARLAEREEKGLLSFHTATHPDYQGRGLFTDLARRTFAAATAAGYGHVIGVANAASTPGFVKKLGFQLVAPLDVWIGVGPAPSPRGAEARRRAGSDAALAWRREWSDAALAWRLACPARPYRESHRGGRVQVHAPTGRLGIWAELASFGQDRSLGLPSLGGGGLRLWLGLDPRRSFRGHLYVPLPRRLRPSPLHLIFLDLTGAGRTLAPEHVLFRALDFDAY